MTARTLMIQGTASSVGKSMLVAALCRYYRRMGVRVAPFKSQNMALNAFVTEDGGEIGRAQAVQAEAAGVTATVDMNPILLKPEGDSRAQVVVLGKALGRLDARDYHEQKPRFRETVAASLGRLREAYELVIIEGAGSPAEVNLRDRDLVNMFVAHLADAPVLLAGDIDRGGVFASLVGTLELLDPPDRARIKGFLINKFRGDLTLLEPGLDFLEARTGIPVLGVLPYLHRLGVADEDSLSLESRARRPRPSPDLLDIVVLRLPHLANHDDVAPLEREPGVSVRFVESVTSARGADLVIVPGSKTTVSDLAWLRAAGFDDLLHERAHEGAPVLGICGGCQMLGTTIEDPDAVESELARTEGLGLLPFRTRFASTKVTAQVRGETRAASFLSPAGQAFTGYEIHMGLLEHHDGAGVFSRLSRRGGPAEGALDGGVSASGALVGTMVHGLFDEGPLKDRMLEALRARRGLVKPNPKPSEVSPSADAEYDRLADMIEAHVNEAQLAELTGLGGA